MNPIAYWVAEASVAGLSRTDITESLARQYDLDIKTAQKDVEDAITRL